MKIAYVIQNVGGIDLSSDLGDTVPVKRTILGLQQLGHKVDCYQLNNRSVMKYEDITNLKKYQVTPLGISGNNVFKGIESGIRRIQTTIKSPYLALFDSLRFYEACIRFLPNYDLCHEHNGLFCAGATFACRKLRKPYILTVSADPFLERKNTGNPIRGVKAWFGKYVSKLNYYYANKIICVSKAAKNYLIEDWLIEQDKIVVMPNGVDIGLFSASSKSPEYRSVLNSDNNPVICFVGTFQKWHGVDQLVEIFSEVKNVFPNSKLLLIGDGPARPIIEKKIEQLGLKSEVIITGYVRQTEVPNLLALTDVTTIPYPELPKELWFSPLKLYEYMAAGKAIVASNSGQISEVITNGQNGLLIAPGYKKEFAEAIIRLLEDDSLRQKLGVNAQKQALEQHSWDHYVKKIENIYQSIP
jgi:glycosyltransferase involved in cell wall biosynthesis